MGRGGIGSASIVLVFSVLCLTIFAVISLLPALTDERLINAEVRLVEGYYAADTLAERILAEIIPLVEAFEPIPEEIHGVAIEDGQCMLTLIYLVSFVIPVTDAQSLYVEIAFDFDEYRITEWRLRNIGDWVPDESLPVWTGDPGTIFSAH
jgi:hypothetical protein